MVHDDTEDKFGEKRKSVDNFKEQSHFQLVDGLKPHHIDHFVVVIDEAKIMKFFCVYSLNETLL